MNPSRRTPLEQKLGTFIRMLASERDGEVVAAARAIVRTLKAAGADIHVLAPRRFHHLLEKFLAEISQSAQLNHSGPTKSQLETVIWQ